MNCPQSLTWIGFQHSTNLYKHVYKQLAGPAHRQSRARPWTTALPTLSVDSPGSLAGVPQLPTVSPRRSAYGLTRATRLP
jgi:hypothetical protein